MVLARKAKVDIGTLDPDQPAEPHRRCT
jgi:hypothetical protein